MKLKSVATGVILATTSFLQLPTAAAVETPEFAEASSTYRLSQRQLAEQRQEALLAELRLINGPYGADHAEFTWAVDRWRPIVAAYFPEERID